MTDITVAAAAAAPPGRRLRRPVLLMAPLLLAGAGFASSWFGLWSPLDIVGMGTAPAAPQAGAAVPATSFVDVPAINLTIPDARPRLLHLVVKLEVAEADAAEVEQRLPRAQDAFSTFLTGIAPEAFDRRGIVEIIREELATRARLALGTAAPVSVLIMEFALK